MERKREQKHRLSDRGQGFVSAAGLLLLSGILQIALSCRVVLGQINPGGPSIFGSGPIISSNHSTPLERARRKAIAAERARHQEEMAADVARLLELANELDKEEKTEGSNPQGNADKARQIERLAHRVQTLMREAGEG